MTKKQMINELLKVVSDSYLEARIEKYTSIGESSSNGYAEIIGEIRYILKKNAKV